jgi:hypothetical protein
VAGLFPTLVCFASGGIDRLLPPGYGRAGTANERYGCRRAHAEEAHQQSAHVQERQVVARRPGRPVSSRLPWS